MIPPARALTKNLPPHVQEVIQEVYTLLVGVGCDPDVKTRYISFTRNSCLVGSAHVSGKQIELALALPEDHPSDLIEDASHLTWRTLPVCLRLTASTDRQEVLDLVREALARVVRGEHTINRPAEFFGSRPRRSNWNS